MENERAPHFRVHPQVDPLFLLGHGEVVDSLTRIAHERGVETRPRLPAEATPESGIALLVASFDREDTRDSLCRLDRQLPSSSLIGLVSSLDDTIQTLIEGVDHPERIVGLHVPSDLERHPLVTIIAAPKTDRRVLARAWQLVARLGLSAIRCDDIEGFVLGALRAALPRDLEVETNAELDPAHELDAPQQAAIIAAGADVVERGLASTDDVDLAARLGLGWRLGPFELANALGVPRALRQVEQLAESRPTLRVPAPLARQAESGQPFELRRVQVEMEGGLARVLLHRPDALNALSIPMLADLESAFATLAQHEEIRTIVVAGMGKAFMAGVDTGWLVQRMEADDLPSIVAFVERVQRLFRGIETSKALTILQLDGLAVGAGAELACCVDRVLATPRGCLGFPETGIGIYPALGGTQRCPRRTGIALARWLILGGEFLRAERAWQAGLVDELVEVDEVEERIHELHAEGGSGSAATERAQRNAQWSCPHPDRLDEELRIIQHTCEQTELETLLTSAEGSEVSALRGFAHAMRRRAPLALRHADELLRATAKTPLMEGLSQEIARLAKIFPTEDALRGLRSAGRQRVRFEGR
jgi:enoyl-CoA hydratase/3-hydroxyacyl-CoA dehydrogenase